MNTVKAAWERFQFGRHDDGSGRSPAVTAYLFVGGALVGATISSVFQESIKTWLVPTSIVLAAFALIATMSMVARAVAIITDLATPPVVAMSTRGTVRHIVPPDVVKTLHTSLRGTGPESSETRVLLFLDASSAGAVRNEQSSLAAVLEAAWQRSEVENGPRLVLVYGQSAEAPVSTWWRQFITKLSKSRNTEVRLIQTDPGMTVFCVGHEFATWSTRASHNSDSCERSFAIQGERNRDAVNAMRETIDDLRREADDIGIRLRFPDKPENNEVLVRLGLVDDELANRPDRGSDDSERGNPGGQS